MPTKFKAIDENGEVLYVAQKMPWAQRQGIPKDPLQSYNLEATLARLETTSTRLVATSTRLATTSTRLVVKPKLEYPT